MNSELQAGIREVRDSDADYPDELHAIQDKPPVLFIKGKWPLPKGALRIGIVGARLATSYGKEMAARLARDLARRGILTVSGLALGIDASAHEATLEEGGWTVAVLGNGFGYCYPKANTGLYERIAKEGTLMTEFSYDTGPQSEHFPRRNRIISGLSQGVVVVEASERSGALITARFAATQGRDVFAVPGNVSSWQSRGANRLIKEGAKLVDCAEEICAEYEDALRVAPPLSQVESETRMPEPEGKLLELLKSAPLSLDEIVELSGQSVDRLAGILLSLELKGRIHVMPGQRYVARY
jgi:DNA processing protein